MRLSQSRTCSRRSAAAGSPGEITRQQLAAARSGGSFVSFASIFPLLIDTTEADDKRRASVTDITVRRSLIVVSGRLSLDAKRSGSTMERNTGSRVSKTTRKNDGTDDDVFKNTNFLRVRFFFFFFPSFHLSTSFSNIVVALPDDDFRLFSRRFHVMVGLDRRLFVKGARFFFLRLLIYSNDESHVFFFSFFLLYTFISKPVSARR